MFALAALQRTPTCRQQRVACCDSLITEVYVTNISEHRECVY